jgi:uncharacterized protein (DUF2249 family)
MSHEALVLDVREDICRGREPFSKVMMAVASLALDQDLVVLAPFEPIPMYHVLAQQGLRHSTETTPEGDFKVRFSRQTEPVTPPKGPRAEGRIGAVGVAAVPACDGVPILDVDARGLEPPQPMVSILEALGTLPKGAHLRAHTDRRPMHLYPQLEDRGFAGVSEEQSDGSFVTLIQPRQEKL